MKRVAFVNEVSRILTILAFPFGAGSPDETGEVADEV